MARIQCGTSTFSAVKAVLLDKDGTLANSQDFLRQLGQRRARLVDVQVPGVQEPLLMAFGVEGNRLRLSGLMAVGTRWENEIAAAAYVAEAGKDWLEARDLVRSAFVEADQWLQPKAAHTWLYDGVLELLKRLAATGIKVGILSADTSANVEEFVAYYQLAPMLTLAMGTDSGVAKPDPVMYQRACAALAVDPADTVMIGDAIVDMQMAQNAGAMGSIGATWGTGLAEVAYASVSVASPSLIEVYLDI